MDFFYNKDPSKRFPYGSPEIECLQSKKKQYPSVNIHYTHHDSVLPSKEALSQIRTLLFKNELTNNLDPSEIQYYKNQLKNYLSEYKRRYQIGSPNINQIHKQIMEEETAGKRTFNNEILKNNAPVSNSNLYNYRYLDSIDSPLIKDDKQQFQEKNNSSIGNIEDVNDMIATIEQKEIKSKLQKQQKQYQSQYDIDQSKEKKFFTNRKQIENGIQTDKSQLEQTNLYQSNIKVNNKQIQTQNSQNFQKNQFNTLNNKIKTIFNQDQQDVSSISPQIRQNEFQVQNIDLPKQNTIDNSLSKSLNQPLSNYISNKNKYIRGNNQSMMNDIANNEQLRYFNRLKISMDKQNHLYQKHLGTIMNTNKMKDLSRYQIPTSFEVFQREDRKLNQLNQHQRNTVSLGKVGDYKNYYQSYKQQ